MGITAALGNSLEGRVALWQVLVRTLVQEQQHIEQRLYRHTPRARAWLRSRGR